MFPRLPRVLRAPKHGPLTLPAPLVRMSSSHVAISDVRSCVPGAPFVAVLRVLASPSATPKCLSGTSTWGTAAATRSHDFQVRNSFPECNTPLISAHGALSSTPCCRLIEGFGRVCAVTSIVDCSIRSIESIDGRYGGCWRRSSPKPPSHKPRRRLNSSSTPGPVDCARAVWRKRFPGWVPFGAAPPQVTRPPPPSPRQSPPNRPVPLRQVRRCSGKPTRARALRRRRRSLARSIARAVCGGSDGVRLHRPSRALRASRVTRAHAHVIAAHRARRHRFPFPLPARMRALRAATALARSLARSLARARAVWRWRWRWRSVTSRVTRVTRARVHVIAAHRARHHRPPSPDVTHTRARQRRRRCLVCSLARARGGGGGGVGGGGRLLRASRVSNTSRAPLVTRAYAHIITASRASSPFSVPPAHDRHARAAAAAALARSLARVRCGVGGGGGGGVQLHRASCARVTHVTRARVHVIAAHRARHHRPPSPMSPMRARGSGGGAVSFARSLARAEAEAVGLGEAVGYIARHACQTRHARRSSRARTRISSPLRARHHRFPSPPRTTGTRALLRRRCSLARSRACGVALALAVEVEVAFSYTAHHARHARARVRHHRASRASSPPPFPDVTHARARQRWRRCLVCSLPRARGGGGGRSFARRACLARHARARARHHRHGTC